MSEYKIINADCIEAMRAMPDNSVDSIVCDPPYELGFMGKTWDNSGIAYRVEMWAEALRVLKPGGHLLAFSGSRTYHRMTCAIEDAGFEIRDQIMWVYGSGFPKSLDVSKAIDKAAGHARATDYEPNFGNATFGKGLGGGKHNAASEPAVTDAAHQWEGWGTALKPAHEPICVARKPLVGTVAANVLAFGTGALNIDGCRVAGSVPVFNRPAEDKRDVFGDGLGTSARTGEMSDDGRWPANIIHDGSDEVLALFPETTSGGGNKANKQPLARDSQVMATVDTGEVWAPGTGSAARFFQNVGWSCPDCGNGIEYDHRGCRIFDRFKYCAKASKADRGDNNHPTVKPTALMAYLVRLVTPPGGLVLDPFMGSGSTGKACMREGFRFIGCELSAEYVAIAEARIVHELYGDVL